MRATLLKKLGQSERVKRPVPNFLTASQRLALAVLQVALIVLAILVI